MKFLNRRIAKWASKLIRNELPNRLSWWTNWSTEHQPGLDAHQK
jgi:hypothetical protein